MATAWIGIGANLGDREGTDRAPRSHASTPPAGCASRASTLRETEPMGGPVGQPAYLNGAARLETSLEPRALLALLLAIESDLGRVRAERFGPRTIDLDLLVYEVRPSTSPTSLCLT